MITSISLDLYYLAPMIILGAAILILLLLLLLIRASAKMCAVYAASVLFVALIFTVVLGIQVHRGDLEKSEETQKHLLLTTSDKHGENGILSTIKKTANASFVEKVDNGKVKTQSGVNVKLPPSQMQKSQEKLKAKLNKDPIADLETEPRTVVEATYVTALFTSDAYALLYTGLILIISMVVVSFASSWFKTNNVSQGLFYLILLFSALGGIILVYSSHLISLFIGIELLSTPLIGLIGFQYTQNNSIEATTKYMILSVVATAFLLLGIAFYYAATGELTFSGLSFQLSTQPEPSPLLLSGVCLMLVGIGFKLSLVPFQLWLPDVFQGAPTPISLFLSTVGKLSIFCAIARLFLMAPIVNNESIQLIVVIMAFSSILLGNFFALKQENIKRLIAYASITNYGYLFVALIAVQYQVLALETIGMSLISYILSNICVFGAINLESSAIQNRDKEMIMDLKGLFWRKPIIATSMAIGLLSMAGIPLTIGFIGRFLLLLLSVTAHLWWLIAAIVIGSVFGIYFYLRVIINLYLRNRKDEIHRKKKTSDCRIFQLRVLNVNEIILIISAILIVLCGIYPQLLLSFVSSARYLMP